MLSFVRSKRYRGIDKILKLDPKVAAVDKTQA